MRRKTFMHALSGLCVLLMACGTAFAQQAAFAQQGKIQSGPYKGPMVPMAAPEAPAAGAFFSNLVVDTCTGCNYSTVNGLFIWGPNNCFQPGSTQWIAYPFTSTKTGAVRKVLLAITDSGFCVAGSTKFTVAIYTDACTGAPGTQIGTAVTATAPAAPCSLATANFGAAGVSLTAGTPYWVVVTTSSAATQNATTAVWWQANLARTGVNFDDGNGWQASGTGGPGGFTVQ